jgi:transposase
VKLQSPTTKESASPEATRHPPVRFQIIHGVKYWYEDYSYYDQTKKQARHKRIYIGRDDSNGNFIASRNYTKNKLLENLTSSDSLPSRKLVGATYLLDCIANKLNLIDDLKCIFPNDYLKILSIAYYTIIENGAAFYRFKKFDKTHYHPFGKDIPSQRISELLSSITESQKFYFFDKIIKRRLSDEYLAYDTTSISSYSELIDQVKYGHNKDGDDLGQINIALVIGEKSYIPVYYRVLPGNINDVLTVEKLLEDVKQFDIDNLSFVMDRGFYSLENITSLMDKGHNFIVGVKNGLKIVSKLLPDASQHINNCNFFLPGFKVFYYTKKIYLPAKKRFKNFNISDSSKRTAFIHIFYDPEKATTDQLKFLEQIELNISKFKNGELPADEIKQLHKYYIINNIEGDTCTISKNSDAIHEKMQSFGYFSLLSNFNSDVNDVLNIYRNKDIVEKAFHNIKNRFDYRKTSFHSFDTVHNAIFIQFISLILIFYIHKVMKENNLYKNYSIDLLIDELDVIERYENKFNKVTYGEITSKQELIYKIFGFDQPKNILHIA